MDSKTLGRKLVVYGIGAGAASIANSADADIIYSGPVEFSGNSIYFDLQNVVPPSSTDDAANDDFHLNSKLTKGSKAGNYGNGATPGSTLSATRGAYSRSYALKLGAGDTIGNGGNFNSSAYLQNHYLNGGMPPVGPPGLGLGDWQPGDRGFLGLSLTVGANTFFGWADVTLNNLDGSSPGVFTLHDYAYEDIAEMAIEAGAIPEPSTIALLVAGAAGVLALKRRKK